MLWLSRTVLLLMCLLAFCAIATAQDKGWFGVVVEDVTGEDVRRLGLTKLGGVLVRTTADGSPAEAAGLKPDDIILSLDGQTVTDIKSFVASVSGRPAGTILQVEFVRGRKQQTIAVRLDKRGAAPSALAEGGDAKAAELVQLLTLAQFPQNPDEGIEAARKAIALEPQVNPWTLKQPRDLVRGLLWSGLGKSYFDRRTSERADNIEQAIAAYDVALKSIAPTAFPDEWAETEFRLSDAFSQRIRGERAENLERAIAALEAALTLVTRDAHPMGWARAQNDLGNAYFSRVRGDKAENLERAIVMFRAALSVLTREDAPQDWALVEANLGNAFQFRKRGDQADNLEQAISAYESSVLVRTRAAFPQEWALTEINIGAAYYSRLRGTRSENIETAIKAYSSALEILKPESNPRDWADAQHDLGNAYEVRISGTRSVNLKLSIAAYESALRVFTPTAWPRDHLKTGRLLGHVLTETHEWQKAKATLESARNAFLLLFGQGLDEAAARDLLDQADTLFPDAAYSAVQLAEPEAALELLNEGKSRLLAVALKLQNVDLTAGARQRLDRLRRDVSVAGRRLEVAHGTERVLALEQLATLNTELLGLVKDAQTNGAASESALAMARGLVAQGGAVAAPVITQAGGKLLLVSEATTGPVISVVDLPDLTTARLDEALRGAPGARQNGGWLGAFNIQYLPEPEKRQKFSKWIAAIDTIGPTLWQLFAGALANELTARGVPPGARVVILPTGSLGLLPLGLAQDPATGRRLLETYELVEAPSLEALAAAARLISRPVPRSLAVVANPTGELPKLALPFTEIEGALVASHFAKSSTIALDKSNASPEAVLAALKDKTYWHFSSHGFFDWSDARNAGLLMRKQQPLTVGRLLEEQGALGRPRLVVLSACETGLYETNRNPDEFVGLPATFMELGSAGVLGALWQVDDMATALLMAKFYELHLERGLNPPAALKAAQAWLRTATKADIVAYGQAAVQGGKLVPEKFAELETLLNSRSRSAGSRFASAWDLLQGLVAGADQRSTTTSRADRGGNRKSYPFAHPYYWGGFVYTGI